MRPILDGREYGNKACMMQDESGIRARTARSRICRERALSREKWPIFRRIVARPPFGSSRGIFPSFSVLSNVVSTGCNRSVERSRYAESLSDEREQ